MGKSRESEHKAFLDWLLEVIKSEHIEALLVSGDIFDTGTPPNYALELYYDFLKELSSIQTLQTTIITAGNHDSIATLKAPQELLRVLNVHVITSGDENEEVIIPIYKEQELQAIICAVPFLRDSVIRSSMSGESITQRENLANAGIKAYYKRCHQEALELKQEHNIPIIAMGHLTMVGSKASESERDIYIGGTLDIGGGYLGAMFDYVALGHLHINQRVGDEHIRYSGSPIPLSFSEIKNRQKVNIVDVSCESIKVDEREIPRVQELIVLKGDQKSIEEKLKQINDDTTWIEVHLRDDNPMAANQSIRALASELKLTLLAIKIERSPKEIEAKQMRAISLQELSIHEVFAKRLELEEIESDTLKEELQLSFEQVVERVQA
jgi:exonuclease SbcD